MCGTSGTKLRARPPRTTRIGYGIRTNCAIESRSSPAASRPASRRLSPLLNASNAGATPASLALRKADEFPLARESLPRMDVVEGAALTATPGFGELEQHRRE